MSLCAAAIVLGVWLAAAVIVTRKRSWFTSPWVVMSIIAGLWCVVDVTRSVQEEEQRRKAEEDALLNYRFIAKEPPAHVREPLFARMMQEREEAKKLNHEARVAVRARQLFPTH
jgi:hypothetical protein